MAQIIGNSFNANDPNGNNNAIRVSDQTSGLDAASFVIERNSIIRRINVLGIGSSTTRVNVIRNNLVISGNGYSEGIAANFYSDTTHIVNNTIVGTGLYIYSEVGDSASILVVNNLIAFADEPFSSSFPVDPEYVFNNNFYDEWPIEGDGVSFIGTNGNRSVDPEFIDAANGNYRLVGTSPLIDEGNASLVALGDFDFDGNDRVTDGNFDQVAVVDIGAFEFVPEPGGIAMLAAGAASTVALSRRRSRRSAKRGE